MGVPQWLVQEATKDVLPCVLSTIPHIIRHLSISFSQATPSLANRGSAGVYGMVGAIPDRAIVTDFVVEFFNELYTL